QTTPMVKHRLPVPTSALAHAVLDGRPPAMMTVPGERAAAADFFTQSTAQTPPSPPPRDPEPVSSPRGPFLVPVLVIVPVPVP
ncbi:hypothetical protein E4U43_005958, partial [Claviceps pusilla]